MGLCGAGVKNFRVGICDGAKTTARSSWFWRLSMTIFLANSLGHLSSTQRHLMSIENLILDGRSALIVFRKQNNVKTQLSELPSVKKLIEEIFYM